MADNKYKNSDYYNREMDKLTSTNNEIDQSTSTKVNSEKDTKESKNPDNIRKIMAAKKIQHYYG
jgi:hypothetical protein